MQQRLCGKIIHMTAESAEIQAEGLGERYGNTPNIYTCKVCTAIAGSDIFHAGYGYDASKLSKKARRHRKQAARRKQRKLSRLAGRLARGELA